MNFGNTSLLWESGLTYKKNFEVIFLLFNSYEFIFIFLPITLLIYFTLARFRLTKLATASLTIASLVFYSYWDIRNLPLILGSILFNYTIGSILEKTRKKGWLIFGVIINLSILGYFKYTGFFMGTLNDVIGTTLSIPPIILPLGISFFTFTQTAYLVDAYRGETERCSLLTYSLFVTVFPHLIAGPILNHKDMIPQFSKLRNFVFSHRNMALGITVFMIGLFKKVIIADDLASLVNIVFTNTGKATCIEAWTGAVGYALQLYFDFSGYSEMAVGLGLMFNFKLPINFNSPYKATSIIDFWRRWHISLSEFLKNYLYIPLGGNRHGEIKRFRNLLLTMLLGGLWHGAGWTFIIWGGLHGIYLVINHLWRKLKIDMPKFLAWIVTFICVVIAWVFFRANSVHEAMNLIKAMMNFGNNSFSGGELGLLGIKFKWLIKIILLTVLVVCCKNTQEMVAKFKPNWKWAIVILLIGVLTFYEFAHVSEFLYFEF